ncbi:hypothetical protein PV326_004441 [Microctonus aethiopoides]|nr:hypothetical protein PV326_004441 [Microctonus aethiopoides]
MDGSFENSSRKTIKQKFMRWFSKWYYDLDTIHENPDKPDITLLLCLLQSIGFQLRQFEKSNNENIESNNDNGASVKVQIECSTSKMKAILEYNDVKCQCPNSQDSDDASYWSVSGTAPTGSMDSINRYEEAGSTLLPRLNKDTQHVIHDVIYSLLNIMKNNMQEHQNINNINSFDKNGKDCNKIYKTLGKSETFTRCYTQPEMPSSTQRSIKQNDSNNYNLSNNLNRHSSNIDMTSIMKDPKIPIITTTPAPADEPSEEPVPSLLRQDTWDMELKSNENEPRPLLPQNTYSSNISTELSTSLGQVSLQSDDSTYTLMECLKRARFFIEKAQTLQANKQSPQQSLTPSVNKPKNINSINKLSPRSKISRTGLLIRPTLSSAAKSNSQKTFIRRSTIGIVGRSAGATDLVSINSPKVSGTAATKMTPSKTMSTNLPVRSKTIGESSQTLELAVAGAQRKITASKIKLIRPLSSSANSNSNNNSALCLSNPRNTSVKQRYSEGMKDSNLRGSLSNGDICQIKSSNIARSSTSGGSSTNIADALTPKTSNSKTGISLNIKKPTSNLTKFGFTKK